MADSQPAVSPRRFLSIALAILVLLVVAAYLFRDGDPPSQDQSRRGGWDAPAVVRVATVERGSLDVLVQAIGTVTPLNTVTVRSRVSGVLEQVVFEEGARVERGALLAVIDPLPYAAQLEQAEGQLQQNRARLENARSDLSLYEELWEQDSIARQQLSDQRALVKELEGTVRADEARVEDARLQLSWTRIEAPIAGKLGLRRVDAGNLVGSGEGDGLVSIAQMQPIAVNFTVPEVEVPALLSATRRGEQLTVRALDRSGLQLLATGELTTLDNQIDTTTGTLRVRARFANQDLALFPNQFVNVELRLDTLGGVLTIPSDAVQYGNQRTYVYVVEDGHSYLRDVVLGPAAGDTIVVREGLAEGEQVILEGLDRLRDGKQVILRGDDPQVDDAGATGQ